MSLKLKLNKIKIMRFLLLTFLAYSLLQTAVTEVHIQFKDSSMDFNYNYLENLGTAIPRKLSSHMYINISNTLTQ